MEYDGKVLMLGYGSVAKCTLPIMLKHIQIPISNITLIDFEDKHDALKEWTSQGLNYVQHKITKENLEQTLSQYLPKANGLLIDLAWNIGCNDILKWCHENHILYINTSVEQWDPELDMDIKSPFEKSLYFRQMKLRDMIKNWRSSTTAVLDHGANPGLISHFTKQALLDITERLIKENKVSKKEASKIAKLAKQRKFPELAMTLGVKVIH